MTEKVMEFPNQLATAYALAKSSQFPSYLSNNKKISSIVIIGMGGSGIVGDFIRVLMRNSPLPVHVHKGPVPPRYLDSNTLVILITNSGKTKETLDALSSCQILGTNNIVITSSKELRSSCNENNIPCILVPENNYTRTSLGYMLVPVLMILHHIGVFPTIEGDISESIQMLNKLRGDCGPNVPLKTNPAGLLALELVNSLPVIYGEYNFTDVIALRWKQQLNENSKVRCYYDVFPELLHNEVEVWDASNKITFQKSPLLLLRDSVHEENTNLREKIETVKYLAESRGAKVFDLWTRGKSELCRLLTLSYLGDFVSVYLATSKGVDPTAIHNIEYLKQIDENGDLKKFR
jgi:glucose/mannose-6-phosphate isomerase